MNLEEIIERIKERTVEFSGCWLWQGAVDRKGYGMIGFNGKLPKTHRLSAAYYLGFDLTDKTRQINHKAGCTHKNCWNPEHLYIGTAQENTIDSVIAQTHANSIKTHCKNGHEYTEETLHINRKNGKRGCKICRYESVKLHRELYGR